MIHVLGSWYMAWNGGFKPCPEAFIRFIKAKGLKPKKAFFLGDRLLDMEVADSISKKMKIKVIKCLILRGKDRSLGEKHCDHLVKSLTEALSLIKKLKLDLVLTDFDNTLVKSVYDPLSDDVERIRFWEKYGCNPVIRVFYGLVSQIDYLLFKRQPFPDAKKFLTSIKVPVIIHSMSPESVINRTLKEMKIKIN